MFGINSKWIGKYFVGCLIFLIQRIVMVDESPHNLSFSKICEAAEVTNFTFLCSGMKTSMMTRVGVAMDHAWARLQIDCAEHNLNSGPAGRDLAPGRIR